MDKFFRFIPGFRSNILWKKILASFYYLLAFISLFGDLAAASFLFVGPFVVFSFINLAFHKRKSISSAKALIAFIAPAILMFIALGSITPDTVDQSNSSLPQSSIKNQDKINGSVSQVQPSGKQENKNQSEEQPDDKQEEKAQNKEEKAIEYEEKENYTNKEKKSTSTPKKENTSTAAVNSPIQTEKTTVTKQASSNTNKASSSKQSTKTITSNKTNTITSNKKAPSTTTSNTKKSTSSAPPKSTYNGEANSKVTASYVGNANTKKFHKSGCSAIKKMNPDNVVNLSSRDTAINGGFNPCGICKP